MSAPAYILTSAPQGMPDARTFLLAGTSLRERAERLATDAGLTVAGEAARPGEKGEGIYLDPFRPLVTPATLRAQAAGRPAGEAALAGDACAGVEGLRLVDTESVRAAEAVLAERMPPAERGYYRALPVTVEEKDDWAVPKTDPDGVLRDPLQERERYIEDAKPQLAFINGLPPGRILDVGCGPGHILSAVAAGWDKHGVEISPTAAAAARAHATVFQGPLEESPYADGSFDVVLMRSVIEHLTDPVGVVRRIHRILKPLGHFIVSTPNFDSAAARRFGKNYRLLHPLHIAMFSDRSLIRMLEDLGFTVDRVEYPYFETRYFTKENLERLFDASKTSPPFYGNHVILFARKTGSRP